MDESRVIQFEGIANARDLGGMKTGSGQTVRRGCMIRSANLSKASAADVEKLKEMRLSCVIDLRTPMAREQKPDVSIAGAAYYAMPVFSDAMVGVSHENDRNYEIRKNKMPDMRVLYQTMLTEPSCLDKFGKVLTLIMEHDYEKEGSVLWHCSEGKDRCGLVSAFLLKGFGVSDEDIIEDYLYTNKVNEKRAEYYYNKVLENGGDKEVALSVRNAFIAKEEYLGSALELIDHTYPVYDDFIVRGLGVSVTVYENFKKKMLL